MKLILLLLFTTCSIYAQDLNTTLSQKEHVVKSSVNNKEYLLYVSLPKGYNSKDSIHYPVLYILDANYSYPIADAIHGLLDSSGEIEKMIIVAIGDKDETESTWLISRTLDYTPSKDSIANADIARGLNISPTQIKSGGAKDFLATIQKDIIPLIDKKYKTTNNRGIMGHSLGGLFVSYCLINSPNLFKRYGISSPSLFWNNEEILSAEKNFASKNKNLNVKVFISVGGEEPTIMYPSINSFINSLKEHQYNGLLLSTQTFENETHISVVPAALSRTIKNLYGTKQN